MLEPTSKDAEASKPARPCGTAPAPLVPGLFVSSGIEGNCGALMAVVQIQPLEDGLGQQSAGGVPSGLEELLRLVEQTQGS